MVNLVVTEVLSYTEWLSAKYWSTDNQEYEIVFAKNFSSKKIGERKDLIAVRQHGESYSGEDEIWQEITEFLNEDVQLKAA